MDQLDPIPLPGDTEDIFSDINERISLQDMLLKTIVEGSYMMAPTIYEKQDNTVTIHLSKLKGWCPKFELSKFVKFIHRPLTLISKCEIKLDNKNKPNDLQLTSLHPDFVIERINNFCQLCNNAGSV